jgi:hypothetical protein
MSVVESVPYLIRSNTLDTDPSQGSQSMLFIVLQPISQSVEKFHVSRSLKPMPIKFDIF